MSESAPTNKDSKVLVIFLIVLGLLLAGVAYLHFTHKTLLITNKGIFIGKRVVTPIVQLPKVVIVPPVLKPVVLVPVVKNPVTPVQVKGPYLNHGIFVKGYATNNK